MKGRVWVLALLACLLLGASAMAAEPTDTWADEGNYTAPTNFNADTKEITVTSAAELGWVSATVAKGQTFDGVQTKISEHYTTPPKHFTEDLYCKG